MKKEYSLILAESRDDVCWVVINRPHDRNSINTALMGEITQVLKEMEQTAIRAMVFTGSGETHFIGGADGIEMMQCDPEGALAFSVRIQELFNRMEESPLIMVAAINGLCFGGGLEFSLACDFRIASDSARIGLPEVKVGLIPGGGGTQRLPRVVGMGRAMEMILSGKLYQAKDARDLGLIHRAVPGEKLLAETQELLKPVLANPRHALTHAKRALRASQWLPFSDGLQNESREFKGCFSSDFFVSSMCQQIRSGVLKTTSKLPEWVYNER